jgi:hypothetical protein
MINDVGKTIIITPPIFLGMVKHNTYKIGVDWGMVNMLINQRNHNQPLELGLCLTKPKKMSHTKREI